MGWMGCDHQKKPEEAMGAHSQRSLNKGRRLAVGPVLHL